MASKNLAEDPYERLANAIILSAVADYRAALKKVTWHKHICYYDSVESVRQRRALEAKNFRGFLRE